LQTENGKLSARKSRDVTALAAQKTPFLLDKTKKSKFNKKFSSVKIALSDSH
jgi:hypothetical protein